MNKKISNPSAYVGIAVKNPMSTSIIEIPDTEYISYNFKNKDRNKAILMWTAYIASYLIVITLCTIIFAALIYWINEPLMTFAAAFLALQLVRLYAVISFYWFENKVPPISKTLTKIINEDETILINLYEEEHEVGDSIEWLDEQYIVIKKEGHKYHCIEERYLS